jgi:hypothetical protein
MSRYQRHLLPSALDFYRQELGPIGRSNRAGWCACRCPFHKQSKSGKSFAVHVEGAFVCRGCGVKGGDLPAFVRWRDGCDFPTACKLLGAWVEDAKPVKVRPGPPVRFLVVDFNIDGTKYDEEVRDEPRTELQLDRRFYADAKDRLAALRNGDAEVFEGEAETQWGILATSWELIQMEVGDGK